MFSASFRDPAWLCALALLPLVAWLRTRRAATVFVVPNASAWHQGAAWRPSAWRSIAMLAGLALLVVAIARPQLLRKHQRIVSGYDIMLVLDLSKSMLSEDYINLQTGHRLSRIDVVMPLVTEFVARRKSDRIGVVVFAGRAYTLAPLTFEHAWLISQLRRIHIGLVEDGTAIGDALGTGVARLGTVDFIRRRATSKQFVVLFTDGANNSGALRPLDAARVAASRGIHVYCIGVGAKGDVPYPVFNDRGIRVGTTTSTSDLDEATLETIARTSQGQVFIAGASDTLAKAFAAIDQAEKVQQVDERAVERELFWWFSFPALLAFAAPFTADAVKAWRQGQATIRCATSAPRTGLRAQDAIPNRPPKPSPSLPM